MKDDYGRDNYKLAIQGSVEDLRTKEGITYIYDEEVLKGLLKKIDKLKIKASVKKMNIDGIFYYKVKRI